MKKSLLTFLVIGAISISSCKKDELSTPDIKQQINGVDTKILCTGCGGGWDLNGPDFSTEITTNKQTGTDTTFVNSKRFRRDIPVIPTNSKEN